MGIVGGLAVVDERLGLTQKANKLLLNANILGSISLLRAVKVKGVLTWTRISIARRARCWYHWARMN